MDFAEGLCEGKSFKLSHTRRQCVHVIQVYSHNAENESLESSFSPMEHAHTRTHTHTHIHTYTQHNTHMHTYMSLEPKLDAQVPRTIPALWPHPLPTPIMSVFLETLDPLSSLKNESQSTRPLHPCVPAVSLLGGCADDALIPIPFPINA